MGGQNTSTAVMASRKASPDELDYYPTPPWGTRALCEHILGPNPGNSTDLIVWECACGEGYMARPLAEFFDTVIATDVTDYSASFPGQTDVRDFLLGWGKDPVVCDWVITNPPFVLAQEFIEKAMRVARLGVAMLVRTSFLEGGKRFTELFKDNPPDHILQFSERIPMEKGKCRKEASSATAYCWLIWDLVNPGSFEDVHSPRFFWIPPGTRKRLEQPWHDYPEWGCDIAPTPLFDEPKTRGEKRTPVSDRECIETRGEEGDFSSTDRDTK